MDYYIFKGDESFGPVSIQDLKEYDLNPDSKIWRGGLTSWTEARNLPELTELLAEIEAEKEALKSRNVTQSEPYEKQNEEDSPTAIVEGAEILANDGLSDNISVEKEYYVGLNGKESGPYSLLQVKGLQITPFTLVWTDGMIQWQEARTFPELSDCFENNIQSQAMAKVARANTDTYHDDTDANNVNTTANTLIAEDLSKTKAKVWVVGILSVILIFGGFMSLGLPTLIPAMPVVVLLLLAIDKIDGTKSTTLVYKAKSLYKAVAYSNAIITIWFFTIFTLVMIVLEQEFMERIFDYIISFRDNF